MSSPYEVEDTNALGVTESYNANEQLYYMKCHLIQYDDGKNRNLIIHNEFKLTPNRTIVPDSYKNYYKEVDGK